jgi:hydrophobic/amphiphilic exporter-1 (mainly G- bacteria), HAE1 family
VKVIDSAIRYPVTTAVGVILLVLFGGISLFRIPIQLIPDVEEPKITVSTFWQGASPYEVEREIIQEQEEMLKSLEGLIKMESTSQDSSGTITLTFQVGTRVDTALLRVSNQLEQVRRYPENVDKPVIRSVDISSSPIAWIRIRPLDGPTGFTGDISTLNDYIEDFVKPQFERVPGVATVNVYGGRQREMQVIFDPALLAARRVTLGEMAAALDRENRNFSGGDFDEGKRRYIVRTVGEYTSAEEIEAVIITRRGGVPVYVRDVARVELSFKKPRGRIFHRGDQAMMLNTVKEAGANVLDVMDGIKETIRVLNREVLARDGLELIQVYDETEYIHSSIRLVRNSLLIGSILAVGCLLLFLRSGTSTLVVATAIPVSVIGSFLLLNTFDRTINVISLAGMAFAVGMVMDNSIVVLENIYRHRQMGKSRFSAAYDGAREVWGAVLASSLTTIAVFVPVLFIQEEAGQLFADIAIAISAAVGLSLIIGITVVPSLSSKILRTADGRRQDRGFHNLWGAGRYAEGLRAQVTAGIYWMLGGVGRRLAVVAGLVALALGLSWHLMPKAEYLPTGNRNLLFGSILPPPGYNVDEVSEMRWALTRRLQPMWDVDPGSPEAEALPGGGVSEHFFGHGFTNAFFGIRSHDPLRSRELIPVANAAIAEIPGAIGFVSQASLFARGVGQGRNIDVEVVGADLETLVELGGRIFFQVRQKMPGAQARPIPSLDLGNPEVRVLTHRRRAADLNLSNRELGAAVSALIDGTKVSDYQYQNRKIDLTLIGEPEYGLRTHRIEDLPIATPDGRLVTVGSVAEISEISGPQQINRSERQRAIIIQVQPPDDMPLEAAMDLIRDDIVRPMEAEGLLGGLYRVHLSGSADKLVQTLAAFRWNFVLAVVIIYLLMAALFESFLYPLVIIFSVPLGAVGGFLGLWVMNATLGYQPLDVLTMLGFIILIGTVVNNAILVVHQSLNHMREEGLEPRNAIAEAVRNRMRPMFMTTSTTCFGLLPLVLAPGAGSELYRGLGAVLLGGLLIATIFTMFLVPALFSLVLDAKGALTRRWAALTGAPTEAD